MADDDLCGQTLNAQYRIEHCIGRGGMGIVWRARHVRSDRLVALKTLRYPTAPSKDVLRRLHREARATAAVRSPNVVRVLDVRLDYVHQGAELPFIVMELLEGQNFADYLEIRRHVDTATLVWVMRQVSRALSLAHRRGIVHRDLKPANVFLAREAEDGIIVKLCDFGVAKLQGNAAIELAETGTLSTETGMVFGTPRYMAPEQLRRAGREGPETDQWAFALIVYRALAGQNYFETARNAAELILAIVHDPLPAPSNLSPHVSQAFDAWFARSCSREPTGRFPDVEVQQQELERALGSPEPIAVELPELVAPQLVGATSGETHATTASVADFSGVPGGFRPRLPLRPFYWSLGAAVLFAVLGTGWLRTYLQPKPDLMRMPQRETATNFRPLEFARVLEAVATSAPAPPAEVPDSRRTAAIPSLAQTARVFRDPKNKPTRPTSADTTHSGNAGALLPRGAPCTRSAQCADGICAAEVCQ
jgi:eukaryotic-like serine/threonine-protein kinase